MGQDERHAQSADQKAAGAASSNQTSFEYFDIFADEVADTFAETFQGLVDEAARLRVSVWVGVRLC